MKGLLQISASAGSGKTYTLAKRYIMLLIFTTGSDGLLHLRQQAGYHNHILAITFTNKATAEMKKRIVDELYILATDPDDSDFMRDFRNDQKDFAPGALEKDKVQQAARQALASVLHDYGTFNVSTIDSFFQSIMRNFAHELDRDYNYEVQIDAEFALKSAIHAFLLSLGADARRTGSQRLTDVERWVKDYISHQVSEGKDWNFFKDDGGLLRFAKLMTMEFFARHMPALHDYLTHSGDDGVTVPDMSRISDFKKHVVKEMEPLESHYRDVLGARIKQLVAKYNIDTERIWANRMVALMCKDNNIIAQGISYTKSSPLKNGFTDDSFVKNNFTQKYQPPQGFIDEVQAWRSEVIMTWNVWQLLKKLTGDLGLLGLINSIDDYLKAYGRETNQLLLSDTNDLIARVLDSGVPFLYERVGTWINHFMIDEFQDTSRKQYDNFKPLLYEALAHADENLCMLIGDAKQSIYRFRNADPSLFRDSIGQDFDPEDHGLKQESLGTNYRSCPAIVRFNNWLFDKMLAVPQLATKDVLKRTYAPNNDPDDYQQKEHKTTPLGMVRIQVVGKSGKEYEDDVLSQVPQILLGLHERFEWGDIGILVNTKEDGKKIVQCIMAHNKQADPASKIEVASDESMLVASSPSVKRIISLLRFIDLTQFVLPDDTLPVADDKDVKANKYRLRQQYHYHVLGLFMERMAGDSVADPGLLLQQCFRDIDGKRKQSVEAQMKTFADEIDRLLPNRRTELMTLTNIVEHIIAQYLQHNDKALIETAHLLAFQDCVNEFATQRGGGTVREFLNFWDTQCEKLSVPASASNDAINVMTIHKSKGLEFECVVMPFVDWKVQSEGGGANGRRILWVDSKTLFEQHGDVLLGGIPQDIVPPLLPLSQPEVVALAHEDLMLHDYVDKFEQDVLVDNMDKTYVAFTRPKQELHMMVDGGSEIGSLIQPILDEGVDKPDIALTKVDETTYQWGEPRDTTLDKPKDDTGTIVMLDMPPYQVASGAARLHVRLPKDLTDKQNTGNRLHNLMSRIAYRRDVERAWGFCLNRGIIRADDHDWPLERIRAIIDRMFDDPRTSDWFSDDNRVYNERNISLGPAAQGKTKRPDRVIRRPDGTWMVIDYKFGEKNLDDNTRQVRDYMQRLARMGKTPIQGYLWYVAHDEVIPVTL